MYISNLTKTFTYLGGKFSILPWLLPIVNIPCEHRIDVFGGSGVVLINCDPAPIETYNDLNGKLVNFFKVLRDQPDELIKALQFTPHSRQEYLDAWYSESDTPLEQARKFFIRTQQSIYAAGAQEKIKGWSSSISESRGGCAQRTSQWLRAVDNLWEVYTRLKHWQIEHKDFRFVMKHYDRPGTHFFLDSPYHQELRSSTTYEFDFENQDFLDMQYWASRAVGKVSITGYKSEFMMELFKDFKFHEGPNRKNTMSDKQAIECCWTNY